MTAGTVTAHGVSRLAAPVVALQVRGVESAFHETHRRVAVHA